MARSRLMQWGAAALVLALALGVWVVWLPIPLFAAADQGWHDFVVEHRTPLMVSIATVLNWVGGGVIGAIVIPLLTALIVLITHGWRWAVTVVVALASSSVAVQILKYAFSRARPDSPLVPTDFGSFPSGHTSHAAGLAIVVWLLWPRVIVVIAAALAVITMALSRTIVSAHWASDTLGGMLTGLAMTLIVCAAMNGWVRRDHRKLGWKHRADPQ
ncbi:phosphatase PAP2 family protein [Microbacterium sp. YY-01]|uniref:phosphatase PAP2 family protein n=1 Tax=Microbacterium sp. YY-01 TaxID=3421634 RepID=UPI003D17DFEA